MNVNSLRDCVTPFGEFRRWFTGAIVLGVVSALLYYLYVYLGNRGWTFGMFAYIFWPVFYAAEAWIQFKSIGRRSMWTVSSFVTLWAFLRPGQSPWVLFVPGALEFAIALGERQRPWAWLIATPLIYGTIRWWAGVLSKSVTWVCEQVAPVQGLFFQVDPVIPHFASEIALILTARAFVGSFIAARNP